MDEAAPKCAQRCQDIGEQGIAGPSRPRKLAQHVDEPGHDHCHHAHDDDRLEQSQDRATDAFGAQNLKGLDFDRLHPVGYLTLDPAAQAAAQPKQHGSDQCQDDRCHHRVQRSREQVVARTRRPVLDDRFTDTQFDRLGHQRQRLVLDQRIHIGHRHDAYRPRIDGQQAILGLAPYGGGFDLRIRRHLFDSLDDRIGTPLGRKAGHPPDMEQDNAVDDDVGLVDRVVGTGGRLCQQYGGREPRQRGQEERARHAQNRCLDHRRSVPGTHRLSEGWRLSRIRGICAAGQSIFTVVRRVAHARRIVGPPLSG